MSIFKYLRTKRSSTAKLAKERLQIIISHEKNQHNRSDYLSQLHEEILEVIAKYVPIDRDQVSVNLQRLEDSAILELNVTMPEDSIN